MPSPTPERAEISYQALHHHTGEELQETEQYPFDLEIQVGASGEDLVVSVRGPLSCTAR
ncbi:hypothetical protein [Nesterenkonia ebinurensis]|uniref:hypothetical protein n=1 Tax=Nesterenkonia ebinurensis TaxID=2608252 RepID=UPI00168A8B8B|nr:hypothetical protein [Nesterenkonia ebinurensis]